MNLISNLVKEEILLSYREFNFIILQEIYMMGRERKTTPSSIKNEGKIVN